MKNEPERASALLIGRAVRRGDWRGRVHSIFRRAVNLAVGDTLFTLISEPLWISESSALVRPAGLAAVGETSELSFQDGCLCLDGRAFEDYRRAEVWRMPEVRGEARPDRLLRLGEELDKQPVSPLGAAVAGKFLERAAAFAGGRPADFTGIIGAGPGLTPAGDDMICGFALALAAVAPARLPELAAACRPLLDQTTDVSRHLLCEAWRGSFGWPLLNLLLAAQGRAEAGPDITGALELAFSIGASSGRDGALGLYHGLRLL